MADLLEGLAGKALALLIEGGEHGVTLKRVHARCHTPSAARKWAAIRALSDAGLAEVVCAEAGRERARITPAGIEALRWAPRLAIRYNFSGELVSEVLGAVRATAPATGSSPTPSPGPGPGGGGGGGGESERAVKTRILRAVERLEPVEGRLVPIHRVRAAASDGVAREAFDVALRGLERDGHVWLTKITDPRGVTEEQRRDSLFHGWTGDLLYYVSRRRD